MIGISIAEASSTARLEIAELGSIRIAAGGVSTARRVWYPETHSARRFRSRGSSSAGHPERAMRASIYRGEGRKIISATKIQTSAVIGLQAGRISASAEMKMV
ncbi:hypothetical protein D3C76_1606290 [compost metagenome]